jgi:hypothetical protein
MTYLRYDLRTGEILATIQTDPEKIALLATEGTGLIEGNVNALEYWVDGDQVKEREAVAVPAALIPLMPSEAPQSVSDGFPIGSSVRVRGTNNMPYEAQIVRVEDGTLRFIPSLAGRYVVQFVGRYSGPEFSFEVQSLHIVRERRKAEVTAKKAEQLAGGFLWNGHRWDADAQAQQNVTSMASAIAGGMTLPAGFFWTSYDNEDVEIDGSGITALSAAMMTFIFSTHAHARSLKEAIEAQVTNESVMSVDIQSGWPA